MPRLRDVDVRLLGAIAAALLLIFGVEFSLPNGPDSSNLTFDPAPRRDISHAKPIEIDKSIESKITSAKDTDFYQLKSMGTGGYLSVHIGNESKTLIPELRVYDSNKNTIGETGDLDYPFLAQANATYYLQVW
jgi:hypothetical protein